MENDKNKKNVDAARNTTSTMENAKVEVSLEVEPNTKTTRFKVCADGITNRTVTTIVLSATGLIALLGVVSLIVSAITN